MDKMGQLRLQNVLEAIQDRFVSLVLLVLLNIILVSVCANHVKINLKNLTTIKLLKIMLVVHISVVMDLKILILILIAFHL